MLSEEGASSSLLSAPHQTAHLARKQNADDGTLLKNLKRDSVIRPQQLSPETLLIPYLPSPDFSLAHPLGPPVTAARTHDPFVRFDFSPLDSPMNPWLRTQYCTSMGKIKSRGNTGLQRGSQRKMGKAVRRARVSASAGYEGR